MATTTQRYIMKHTEPTYVGEILAFLAIFFLELAPALIAIGFLVMADTFTGIWGAMKNGGYRAVTSRKAGRIVAKLVLYPLCIIVAKVSQTYLTPLIPWVDVTLGILAMIEVKSIFENVSIILGYDLWKRVKKALWKDKEEEDKELLEEDKKYHEKIE